MQITLNYGKTGLPLNLPDHWVVTVIRKKPMPVLPDPPLAVRRALESPVAARPLGAEARGYRSACIVICDITRPVPNGLLLPPLTAMLIQSGIPPDRITILVATGLHRPNEGKELRELVGDDSVLKTVRVVNHDARCDEDHVALGTTTQGVPVKIDRRFLEADLRIVTGLVEPHFMAGYSGGRKVIAPGIAHRDTITRLHNARLLEHPCAANCVLTGNPVHEAQLEIAAMIGRVWAVNVVIDEQRRLSFVNFGEMIQSHAAAVTYMRGYAEIPVTRQFQTVVTSSAGYPLDKTYYQTIKGMVGALNILAPGGHLFIASECSEGMGSPEFVASQKRLVAGTPSQFLTALLTKPAAAIDEWETEMQIKAMKVGPIHLYAPGLSPADLALTGVEPVTSLAEAIRCQVAACGDRCVAVIPEGPYVIPMPGT
ncbi:MAG: nickel-dependent lactate racemase [Verrucomicrobia bacterium]|nr:nickel-dependent lactate racemase [Verrucomicrobiota bacterium]MBU1733874.1 nickel-dependent lactate racemase [Verrucomicrobiota bacterium]MBU1856300.1 nickel-dependent lactate racemase [Verrucomicrobiota bacterium]